MAHSPLLQPPLLAQLPPVAIKALRVVEGVLTGLHQSPHRGQSIEFTEHKEYSPGDEIRRIDWKVYGKSDKYYVKQFEDETNLKAYLLVDCSASMEYGSTGESKLSYASVLAASLAYLLLRQQDAVGLLPFDEDVRLYLPPKSRASYLVDLTTALEQQSPRGETHLVTLLRYLSEIARRRSLILLFSDLFDDLDEMLNLLQQFSHRGHDLVIFHILDPDELHFPFADQTLFEDLEQPDVKLQVDPRAIREQYLEEFHLFLSQIQKACQETQMDYWQVNTAQAKEKLLRRFLLQRHHLRRRV